MKQIIPIDLNNTSLVIGKIISFQIKDDVVEEVGYIHVDIANSIGSNGNDGYHKTELIARFQYAKVGIPPQEIK